MSLEPAVVSVLEELAAVGIQLWVDEHGELRYRAPKGAMTDERLRELRARRTIVLEHLRAEAEPTRLVHDAATRHEPFPLTDVQAAYLLGRRDVFPYGGVGCHGYGELEFPELEPERLEAAWQVLLQRHDMLRAVVDEDGSQRVVPDSPAYTVSVTDVRGAGADATAYAIRAAREEMAHRVYSPGSWPLFDVRVTLTDTGARLHMSIDFLIADFVSIQLLLDELRLLLSDPSVTLKPLEVTFRDYLLAEHRLRTGSRYERDRAYWWSRLDELPAAPTLPVVERASEGRPVHFRRWLLNLSSARWGALRRRAGALGITPSGAVLAAYAEVIGRWCGQPRFTLDLTVLQRLPLHPQIGQLVGDFTTVNLLAVEQDPRLGFGERARALQARLWQDLEHRSFSGVEVMRELARRGDVGAALFPVVFTSAIGVAERDHPPLGDRLVYGISQTPQVWIDCQVMERGGALAVNWDVREGVLPDGAIDDMFAAFERLLHRMADGDEVWSATSPVSLPAAQAERRKLVNDTSAQFPEALLHEGLVDQAGRTPDRVAVIAGGRTLSYRELVGRAVGVAERLHGAGAAPRDVIAVVMDKGWEQVVAVIGSLMAGCAYLPIDIVQPAARRAQMLADAGARVLLTQSWHTDDVGWPEGVQTIAVDRLPAGSATPPRSPSGPDDLAYLIYTSGSTGTPKGVMITHRSAWNTIVDVNRRFCIGEADRLLGLAELGFDLSVYDLFGPLAVGGCLVLPDAARRGDPSHWAELVARHGVSVWNSVPAQMQMLATYLASEPTCELPSLRLGLLSGDWIPITLPDQIRGRLPGLELVSLGGATEASIWSIFYPIREVAPTWRSIPYGRPLANQRFHVLDAAMRACPDWVVGELFIGGAGLARGYMGDITRTAERFCLHPESGERLYRTGDLGRYLPDGEIEFLGRRDFQVKIRGHRIELAEIEAALLAHPRIAAATVLAVGDAPLERRLVAFVQAAPAESAAAGPDPTWLMSAAAQAGSRALDGVDSAAYRAYTRALDSVALHAMLRVLQQGGLFSTPAEFHTLDEVLARAEVAPRHSRLVRRWLGALVANGMLVHDDASGRFGGAAAVVDPVVVEQQWRGVEELQHQVGAEHELLEYFRACTRHLAELVRGEDDPLRLLFPEGRLDVSEALYRDAIVSRWSTALVAAAVRSLAEGTADGSPVRVLDVGAGIGGTSASVIAALADIPVEYLYTDLSQFFLNEARRRLGDWPWVDFAVYDLDEDFTIQGLEANTFDVIVAADVLHATRDIDRALGRLRQLLAPGGWLVMVEMTRDHYQIMVSLELLVRLDERRADFEDERAGRDRTFLSRDQWLRALTAAGADTVLCLADRHRVMAEVGMHVFAARFKSNRARVDREELLRHLRQRLPEYMLPAHIEVLDDLPRSASGKLDRRALLARLPSDERRASVQVAAEVGSELERRIADVWSEVLALQQVGVHDSFFELGGDSLLAAQLAGRLREVLPEAAAMFFDDVLRVILEQPTVAQLAASFIVSAPAADLTARPPATEVPLVALQRSPLVRLAGGDGPAWVVVHDAGGTLTAYDDLVAELAGHGPVLGLAVQAPEPYLALAPAELIQRVAGDYARRLLNEGCAPVHLIGCGFGALLALEIARNLVEAGAPVAGLHVVDGDLAADGPYGLAAHSQRAAAEYVPAPYAGDAVVVLPRETDGSEASAALWRDLCLGEVRVVEVPGDRAACLAGPSALALAKILVSGGRVGEPAG